MTITRDQLRELDKALGTSLDDAGLSGDGAPNGHNLIGALRAIQRLGEDMDDFGATYSDLNADQQETMDEAVEDARYWLGVLGNVFGSDLVGADGALELPNGNTVSLPGEATVGAGTAADLPADPRGGS